MPLIPDTIEVFSWSRRPGKFLSDRVCSDAIKNVRSSGGARVSCVSVLILVLIICSNGADDIPPREFGFPQDHDNVVSVAAIDENKEWGPFR